MNSLINKAKNKIELYKVPRLYIEKNMKPEFSKDLHVAVIAAPCHGFGDVVFASKFANYLKDYSNNIEIVTPSVDMFEKIGVETKILPLETSKQQCRRLKNFKRPKSSKFDLFFVAPLQQDFNIDYYDVKALFNESTPFNTIFLSEYQDDLSKGFDLPTGIGRGYYGLLFDDVKPDQKPDLENYVLAYIAKDVGNPDCLFNFIKMIVNNYKDIDNLQIIIPAWALEYIEMDSELITYIYKFYNNIAVNEENPKSRTFNIRTDILPVSRQKMLSLMKYSLPDILVTGDQSVTDVINCCLTDKNIWYQIVPWKTQFAKKLSTALPQKYLKSEKKSCGWVNVEPKQLTDEFRIKNDFRILAKNRLDSIFTAATQAKDKNSMVYRYLKQLDKSVNRDKLKEVVNR